MNHVENALLENINNPNSLFVFPTDIAASSWADYLLRLSGGTIAMNKFIAWDEFKQNSIKSKVQNKKSIPSVLRKIFVSCLLNENAQNTAHGKPPIFSTLIKEQWAKEASRFTPWLTGVLPQLGAWFAKATGLNTDSILSKDAENAAKKMEDDDKDIFALMQRYALFLDKHNFFEPAWETPPFNDEGKEVFIFFPESLSDYGEYRQLLAESNHVKIISAPNTDDLKSDTFFYTNSRSEIKESSLYIRALNENQGVSWDSIAVCIPNSENYEPYVLREFTNRNIPFVKRTSKLLSDYPAGGFFRSILDCASQDFSFSSVVSLIMNKNLPWKKELPIEQLVQFGMDNNCLFSWTEEIDGKETYINVWEDAFKNPIKYDGEIIHNFFNELKKRVLAFCRSETFFETRKQYFIFREMFFDMENCGQETDLILSRCISELMNLVELEKSYPDIKAIEPFRFFAEYLDEISYLPQQEFSGVAILPYKTAAAAHFDCHIVLGAGQESLSVVYSRFDFLSRKKREELGIPDEDASLGFINMHKYNSKINCAFFCSEQTFSGFSIPHSRINSPSEPKIRYSTDTAFVNKFAQDYFDSENYFFSSLVNDEKNKKLHDNQMNGFLNWKNRRLQKNVCDEKWTAGEKIKTSISEKYAKTGKYSVSATSLQKYYQCSFKWLFENVFAIENIQIETSLMAENISGLVYHAILNNFFTELKNDTPLLAPVQTDSGLSLPPSYHTLLEQSVTKIFDCFPLLDTDKRPQMSALTARLLRAGKDDVFYHLDRCLSVFLSFFAGYKVAGSECKYTYEKDTYILNGFIDCILKENHEGIDKYVIVDFKLKNMPKRSACTTDEETPLTDFQLPMYITLIEKNEQFDVYTALFYSILDQKPEVIIGTVYNDDAKIIPAKEEEQIIRNSYRYQKIFEEFENRTEQFTKEISSGNFTVFPQEIGECYNCNYKRICRTVYIIGRENISSLGKH